jgi:hypothetical protein
MHGLPYCYKDEIESEQLSGPVAWSVTSRQKQVLQELADMRTQRDKLCDFIDDRGVFNQVSSKESCLIVKQLTALASYIKVLEQRVELWKEEAA